MFPFGYNPKNKPKNKPPVPMGKMPTFIRPDGSKSSKQPCPDCEGKGETPLFNLMHKCETCDGTGEKK